jgi:hypothetical protein
LLAVDIDAIRSALGVVREALALLLQVKDLLPSGTKKEEAQARLEEAARSLDTAEAQLATELGYQLCKCTWPPQIMLSKGFVEYSEAFECPKCGTRFPPSQPGAPDGWRGAP